MSQSEVDAYLTKAVRVAAEAAGDLHAAARAPGKKGSVFYSAALVEQVSLRLAQGHYPGGKAA